MAKQKEVTFDDILWEASGPDYIEDWMEDLKNKKGTPKVFRDYVIQRMEQD